MADQPDILQPASTIDEKTGNPFPTPGQPEKHSFPGEYIPSSRKECDTEQPGAGGGFGIPANSSPYIWYGNINQADYEDLQACDPFYHRTAQIDSLQINNAATGINGLGGIAITGNINAANITATGTVTGSTGSFALKPFNIPHPTKEGKRLVHACLEGPENGVYFRGRLSNKNIIELPEYWRGLVDPETITVTLTQIGTSQDLIVDSIEWGRIVKVKSGNATKIDCFYTVYGTRKDVAPLPVEMEEGEEWPYKELSSIKIN